MALELPKNGLGVRQVLENVTTEDHVELLGELRVQVQVLDVPDDHPSTEGPSQARERGVKLKPRHLAALPLERLSDMSRPGTHLKHPAAVWNQRQLCPKCLVLVSYRPVFGSPAEGGREEGCPIAVFPDICSLC